MDPDFQETPFAHRVRCLTGFAARVRTGYFGRGNQVRAGTVSGAISAVGKTISLAFGFDPTKEQGSDKRLARLGQMVDGMGKTDPPTMKKLPVEADVPEWLASLGRDSGATELQKALGDSALIAFYYLLRVGEYTTKSSRAGSKQTVQFKMEDVMFFRRNALGQLRQLRRDASDEELLAAAGATLKLDNQKNGWKGVCVFQEANGDVYLCPVRALARRYIHIRSNVGANFQLVRKKKLATYFDAAKECSLTDKHVSAGLKSAAAALDYPTTRGIPIDRVDTHSLRGGGANALHLAGYSDRQIQKMGRWRGETFKEYISTELGCFSAGMSKHMKRRFNFVNVAGGAYDDLEDVAVTDVTMESVAAPYAVAA